MKTSDFDYHLPNELIAQTPAEPRDHSRLMVLHRSSGTIEHRRFFEISEYLEPGDVLVLNDSRVIPARLSGRRQSGGKVEILLLRRQAPAVWQILMKPSRRIRTGETISLVNRRQPEGSPASAQVLEGGQQGLRTIRLHDESLLEELGEVPLPPYIHNYSGDPERYQTVYARENGSVAAPTAGLHFTPELLLQLKEKGVGIVCVTLHVGLDSFRPVCDEDPEQHRIHSEYGELTEQATTRLNSAKVRGSRIVCVGTTTVRLLEQAALANEAAEAVLKPFRGPVGLFILPGHRFRVADTLVTNFHLPRSTLLMLASAFAGKEVIDRAYQEAIRRHYRFYSFGDAMLIF